MYTGLHGKVGGLIGAGDGQGARGVPEVLNVCNVKYLYNGSVDTASCDKFAVSLNEREYLTPPIN
jgi:hypothetical protein